MTQEYLSVFIDRIVKKDKIEIETIDEKNVNFFLIKLISVLLQISANYY